MKPYEFAGRTAVVTGAGSGIGEQLARALAGRGSHLVLLERDGERLERVSAAVRSARPEIAVAQVQVDLADRAATTAAAQRIARDHPRIDLLINNAGVALGGRFDEVTLEEFEWVLEVNFHAPVVLTHHLLPTMQAGAHLVNVSSLYGLISPPGQSAYSASKFALRGFSQVLRAELADRGIGVTTVHPGGIATRIAADARVGSGVDREAHAVGLEEFSRLLTYPPDRAAADILRAVERRRARLLIATSAKVPDVLARLFPVGHMTAISRVLSR
ncbi:SDR family NAD(P)-dependent oxidoreductase [Pseudonocardia adelaidensis]|uniref:SDR family NAD(P)-dependent oxidoreductase n=1 Tax=Pseudonocardia adelaidensis TaxID=648754 RepID=A0ABP9NNE3_9PSEU